jgi:hypothetical protein
MLPGTHNVGHAGSTICVIASNVSNITDRMITKVKNYRIFITFYEISAGGFLVRNSSIDNPW